MLQGLPEGRDQNHWSHSASTGQREGAECLGREEKKGDCWLCPIWEMDYEKAELTQGRRAAWIDPNCFGEMVLQRYSPLRLCREEGRWSGIMYRTRERPLTEIFLERIRIHRNRFIQASHCTQTIKYGKEQGKMLWSTYMTWQCSFWKQINFSGSLKFLSASDGM